jgi:hypothetical protein
LLPACVCGISTPLTLKGEILSILFWKEFYDFCIVST